MMRFSILPLKSGYFNLEVHDYSGMLIYCVGCTDDDFKCLMRAIQSYLPMEVCESQEPTDMFKVQQGIKHLNLRLRKAEEKIVTLEGKVQQRFDDIKFINEHAVKLDEITKRVDHELSSHAGQHMKDNHQERVRNLERSVDSLKCLFDRHYGSVACGHCQESKTVARLVCDINCLTSVVEHLKYKLNEATK